MSVEKIKAELGQVLGALDLATLVQALELIDQAETILGHATQGSQRPEAGQALGLLQHTKQQLGQLYQTVTAARGLVEQYLADVAGGSSATNEKPSSAPTVTTKRAHIGSSSQPGRPKLTREQADAIRSKLPPTVPTPNPEGKKTHGKWFDGSGSEVHIASGRDTDAEEAWRLLRVAGMPTNTEPASVTHVEMKAATRAIRTGAKHTEVVINNIPCGPRRFSCDALLPLLLPEGYSLTVHGPNYRKTYTGGKKWSS